MVQKPCDHSVTARLENGEYQIRVSCPNHFPDGLDMFHVPPSEVTQFVDTLFMGELVGQVPPGITVKVTDALTAVGAIRLN